MQLPFPRRPRGLRRSTSFPRGQAGFLAAVFLLLTLAVGEAGAQSSNSQGRMHFSVSLGGYLLFGFGYSHILQGNQSLEFTVFPLAFPAEGFPFALRLGYGWIPSDEIWRAKLGGNFMVVIRPAGASPQRFVPIVALTPGIQYDPEQDRSVRVDLWMSYYLRQKVFAPTALEILHAWDR